MRDRTTAELLAPTQALATSVTVARDDDRDIPFDLPHNVARAKSEIARDVATHGAPIEGAGSDARTYALAAALRDLKVSDELIVDLLIDWSSFDREWIEIKVANADRFAQNGRGVDAVSSASENPVWQAYVAAQPVKRGRFYPEVPGDYWNLPSTEYLYDGVIPMGRNSALIYGRSGSFKSFYLSELLIGVSHPNGLAFGVEKPSQTGIGVLFCGEGQDDIKRARVPALLNKRGLRWQETSFLLIDNMPLAADIEQYEEAADEIERAAQRLGKRVLMIGIDTMNKMAAGLDENSARDCGLIIAANDMLADRFQCCSAIVHHVPKSETGEDISPRGSGSIYAAMDTGIKIIRTPGTAQLKAIVAKQKAGADGKTSLFEAELVDTGKFNGKGQATQSLVLRTVDAAAFNSAAKDLLRWTSAALERMGATSEAKGVTGRQLAIEMLTMENPEEPPPTDEQQIKQLKEKLRLAATKSDAFDHLCKKVGSKTAERMWWLPIHDGRSS